MRLQPNSPDFWKHLHPEVFCDGGSIGQYYSRARDQVFAESLASIGLRR